MGKLHLGTGSDWESSPPQPAGGRAAAASADAMASLPSGSLNRMALKVARHSECITSIPLTPTTRKESSNQFGSHDGGWYINLEILPIENRAVLRLYELAQGLNIQWKATGLYWVYDDVDDQYESLEQVFGKKPVHYHGKQSANMSFSLMKINFKKDFKCEKRIGKGTEGIVYQCSSSFSSHFSCAVKETDQGNLFILDPLAEPSDVAILSSLNHNNVIELYFAWSEAKQQRMPGRGRATGPVFLCMNRCPRSLEKYLDGRLVFNFEISKRIFKQIIEALAFIHRQGVVNRDIKPGNMLIEDDLTIKIIDFGIAKVKQHSHEHGFAAGVYGSLPYCAPEIANCHKLHDEKVDVFSAGMIYCELFITSVNKRQEKLSYFSKRMRQGMKESDGLMMDFDLDGVLNGTGFLDGWRGDVTILKMLTRADSTKRPSAEEIMDYFHISSSKDAED
uniref:Protein kinase domain-containing protein n=1 Tax=Oryza meridionalis TaxID=40149 RepID=A0A0E0DKA9_9ORYZ